MAIIIDPMASVTLGQAVGNIIAALVDAQARAARTTVEFIDEVGFLPSARRGWRTGSSDSRVHVSKAGRTRRPPSR